MTDELFLGLLFLLILVILILLLLRKHVVAPTLSVVVESKPYVHGDFIAISGILKEDGEPIKGTVIGLTVTDPSSTETPITGATTDDEGKYATSWQIPSDAAPGVWTVTATAMGVSATTTFTLNNNS
jgi:hypothetical protein